MTYNQRLTEIARYVECYKDPTYKMGLDRLYQATQILKLLTIGHNLGWLLDVGAGRGELSAIAKELGFHYLGVDPATGIDFEFVRFINREFNAILKAEATDLPLNDKTYDVVVCLDVLEHLIPDDVVPALREMDRVCSGTLFVTANSDPSIGPDGKDLHISKRSEAAWHQLFVETFVGRSVKPIGMVGVSPGWLIQ